MLMYAEYITTKLIHATFHKVGSPQAAILMLHRMASRSKSGLYAHDMLTVEPEYLEKFIKLSKSRGYSYIALDELVSGLIHGKKLRKCFVVSVDDGYRCTYTTTFPLLKQHDIPFTFFVATSFPDKNAILWWDIINRIIIENSEIVLNDGSRLLCNTTEQKNLVYITLSKRILRMGSKVSTILPILLSKYVSNLYLENKNILIDWDEICEMSNNNLCTIGAHSVDHFGLRYEKSKYIVADMKQSKNILTNKTGKLIHHFAYPYGTAYSVGFREGCLAKEAGFRSALTTFPSTIFKYHKNLLYNLPRINFCTVQDPEIFLF